MSESVDNMSIAECVYVTSGPPTTARDILLTSLGLQEGRFNQFSYFQVLIMLNV